MNILIINGSARKNGNTAALAEAFAEGARSAGAEVRLETIGAKRIQGCLGCEWCHTEGNGACIQQDDMTELYKLIQAADALVLASPIYYFTLSGQLQSFIQRTYAIGCPENLKAGALLLTSGSNGVYGPATAQCRDIFDYWGVPAETPLTSYGPQNKSEGKIAAARALGEKMARG